MTSSDPQPILVTGPTGNVGRHVVSQLLAAGVPVRALCRNPESARLPAAVEIIRGDLTVPETIDAPLDGVDIVFLLYRGLGPASVPVFERIAKRARKIVFLSSSLVRDDVDRQTNPIAAGHAEIEAVIQQFTPEWTLLRPGAFAANALNWWGPQIRSGNIVRWPYGAAAFPPIHERDIASVAVRALLDAGHSHKKYFLTGPQSLTQAEQVRIIGEAIGRPLHFEELSDDQARSQLSAAMPGFIVDILLQAWGGMVTNPFPVVRTVEEITGQPGATFQEWAAEHSRDFRTSAAAAVL
jgi:uncharacterized protein YbjT (DUF2867 family)